jgi:hypothetical protein
MTPPARFDCDCSVAEIRATVPAGCNPAKTRRAGKDGALALDAAAH